MSPSLLSYMLVEELISLGLSKNEAEIYLALLKNGELSVAAIARKSGVNRRNAYDCLDRLLERGLAYEVQDQRNILYQGVTPRKLEELIDERAQGLKRIMPDLQRLFKGRPAHQSFHVYRGIEGWKNCMREILRVGMDYLCIGGKGGWMDPRLADFFPSFYKELKVRHIPCRTLFDAEVRKFGHQIQHYVGKHYRFLPQSVSSTSSVEIFGDRVALVSDLEFGAFREDFCLSVVRDQQLADGFRGWFELLWSGAEDK